MFRFEIYNTWIKKQISKPLEEILYLLESTKDTLMLTKDNITQQISETKKPELQ